MENLVQKLMKLFQTLKQRTKFARKRGLKAQNLQN